MKKILHSLKKLIRDSFIQSYQSLEVHIVLIGYFAIIFYICSFFVWKYFFPQHYENIGMRVLGVLLCVLMILHHYWRQLLHRKRAWLIFIAAIYMLSIQPAYFALRDNGANVPIVLLLMSLFLFFLMFDWIAANLLFISGVCFAIVIYFFSMSRFPHVRLYAPYLPIYFFTVIAASLFSYRSLQLKARTLDGMSIAAATIAHEVRTPLLGIKGGALGLKKYIPALYQGYELARKADLPVPPIRLAHLQEILPTLDRIQQEAQNASTIIDILLVNASPDPAKNKHFAWHSAYSNIEKALERYPYHSIKERSKIIWQRSEDFQFCGSDVLFMHVLFNLIKNGLYYIAEVNKGHVYISNTQNPTHHLLKIRDTGQGISPEKISLIFDRFFSTSQVGTGIGLSFCQQVMDSFGGNISCESVNGEFTEFTLYFPKELSKDSKDLI